MLACELKHDGMLGKVGVLVLVHENVLEHLLVFLKDVGAVTKQDVGIEQQVIKIHRTRYAAALPVSLINKVGVRTSCTHVFVA